MTIDKSPLRPALFAFLMASSAPCLAQADTANNTVIRGPAPDWVVPVEPVAAPDDARGMVFFRRQQSQVHLTADGQFSHSRSHVKLLHPNALQLGSVGITWNPAAGAPTVHTLAIHRDGETIDVLESNSFEILRREDQLEQARLDGLLTAVLQVPDLRVGDEMEIAFTVNSTNPTLADRDFGLLSLAGDPAPGRIQLRLSWDEDADAPATRLTGDLEDFVTRGPRSITIDADSAEALNPPRDAPPRYYWQRVLEFSDFASWPQISQRFDTMFDEARALSADSPVATEAARIARTNESQMAQATAALQLVAQQVRYIFVGLNTGSYTPASAEETWERRYGDCKGKTALLLALLDELGIEAEGVVASNNGLDDGLDALLPNPAVFDHVLVRATIDGREYWLDGTMPGVTIPTARPLFPYRWVLPLADGGADIERIQWQPRNAPVTTSLFEFDARQGFDEPGPVRQMIITRGIDALGEYAQYSALTESQLENAFRNELAGSDTWDTVDDVVWRFDRDQQASVLEIVGTGSPDWEERGRSGKRLTLPGGGFNPPGRRQRDSGQDSAAPYAIEDSYTCYVTTVRLPKDTNAEEWSFSDSFDTAMFGRTYRRMFERRNGAIRMMRVSRAEETEIDAALAARDNERLPDFDNSMAHIYFDRGDRFNPKRQPHVPATYDIDWVNDFSACDPEYDARG